MLVSLVFVLELGAAAHGQITLLGQATIPGHAQDRSGAKGLLIGKVPHDRLGGFSGLAYTGKGNRFIVLSDRGPDDGATQYQCRFHVMDLSMDKNGKLQTELVATTFLQCSSGEPFVGSLKELGATQAGALRRLDPEGVVVGPKGTMFISDEYGPAIHEFDMKGQRLRSFQVPSRFVIAKPCADSEQEHKLNGTGRVPNRGMEGVALSQDGKKLYGLMQGALMQDGGRQGVHVRLLEVDLTDGKTREFVYVLESPACGLNEILAIGNDEFLVIERDSKVGTKDRIARLYRINIAGATDVSEIAEIPAKGLPKNVTPVSKSLFLDFLDARHGLDPVRLPSKLEGLAFGPDLADGRRLLLVATDNDFRSVEASLFLAFAVDRAVLEPMPGSIKKSR
jgi:hypothetical protein